MTLTNTSVGDATTDIIGLVEFLKSHILRAKFIFVSAFRSYIFIKTNSMNIQPSDEHEAMSDGWWGENEAL